MHAEIIAVGTELTTGAKPDTNSQWLSLELAAVGIPVKYHTTVADDIEAMLGVLRDAVNRSDVVLVTGGLGPTLDDLTRDCMAELVQAELVLHERMGNIVFSEEDEELEHVVVRLLRQRRLTLATAEAGTGGLLAHRLTEVADSESCYLGGIVAATAVVRRDLLDVDCRLPDAGVAIGREAALELADACRRRFRTDFALAVTECPHFDPDNSETAAPTSFVALAGGNVRKAGKQTLAGDPAIAKSRTVKAALNLLRLHLTQ